MQHESDKEDYTESREFYSLKLYVTGASPNSIRAISNIKSICDLNFRNEYVLEIIDVYQQPGLAESEQIIALPLLIKKLPLPERRFIGDLSDAKKVLKGVGLENWTND